MEHELNFNGLFVENLFYVNWGIFNGYISHLFSHGLKFIWHENFFSSFWLFFEYKKRF